MSLSNMTGLRRCNEEKVPCRFCKHAEKEHIGRGYCAMYPESIRKPRDVYFDNASCPKFERGEDLLPFEIPI